jgi:Bacterial regulatory proteins, luxR family
MCTEARYRKTFGKWSKDPESAMIPHPDPNHADVMPHTPQSAPTLRSPESDSLPRETEDSLVLGDVAGLLEIAGRLALLRDQPRKSRLELLAAVNAILAASASAAFSLLGPPNMKADLRPPNVALLLEAGFTSDLQRDAFFQEFNTAPFADPLSKAALSQFSSGEMETVTHLRSDLVDDKTWDSDPHVVKYRQPTDTNDCIISLHRSAKRRIHAIIAFKPAPKAQEEGLAGSNGAGKPERFGPRDRALLDTLHRGVAWLYRFQEPVLNLDRSIGLAPHLRKTLQLLLTGQSERKVASEMSLSVHTVHDYVKELYRHFSVTRRAELMAKWAELEEMSSNRDEPQPSSIESAV